jgi:hypothetical protein
MGLASNLVAGWAPDTAYCRRRPADLVAPVGIRLGRYQHSYPVDADALARIRGNVRRAFATSVYVALLERILLRDLLRFEFTSHYQADHVKRHSRRSLRAAIRHRLLECSCRRRDRSPGFRFPPYGRRAKLLADIWTIFLSDRGRPQSE